MIPPATTEALLSELQAKNFAAFSEVADVLPVIEPHGNEVVVKWLQTVSKMLGYDNGTGLAFIRGSRAAEEASETVLPWTEQALKFLRWPAASATIENFMANLPEAFEALGHAGEQRWVDIGCMWYTRHAESGRVYFSIPVADLAHRQGISGIERLMQPMEELLESRKLMPALYLPGAIRVRNLLGEPAIVPWALRGAEVMQAGRLRGEAYFRLESEESLAVLLEHVPGFRAGDRQRLLALLLLIWYEHEYELKESSWSPEQGRAFVETDGRTLYVPAVMRDREEAILAALHTAGHIEFGSFDVDALRAMFAMVGAPPPAKGPISWEPLFKPYGVDMLRFQLIFDACEDLRIDTRIQRQVPNYLTQLLTEATAYRAGAGEALPYYDYALATVRNALSEVRGEPNGLHPRLKSLMRPEATIADAFQIANELYRESKLEPLLEFETFYAAYLPGRSPNAARAVHARAQESDDKSKDPGEEKSNEGSDDAQSGEEAGANADDAHGEEAGKSEKSTGGEGKNSNSGRRTLQQNEPGPENDQLVVRGKPYPEWDYRENRYKRNWAWVQERPLAESNLAEADRLTKQHGAALKRLKKAIQAQKPTRLAPKLRQLDGDDIDLDAVVAYAAERHAGMSPSATIYKRREIRQREIAVTLLADMSTSIMQHLPEGGGRLVDRIRAGVLLFAESMEEVGDSYAIAGFCSKYRENVSYYIIKEFDQPFTQEIKSVIGGMSGRLATRMGTAIRHATHRFTEIESRRRLLLILSDGRPEDYDDGGDRRYLHEDTRMAVKEAVASGVHPFCITVDTMANQYLPQIFGRGHYLVLDQMNSLPNKLPEIYLKLRR